MDVILPDAQEQEMLPFGAASGSSPGGGASGQEVNDSEDYFVYEVEVDNVRVVIAPVDDSKRAVSVQNNSGINVISLGAGLLF